jgi:Fe2+ transport system protein FeoA
MTTTLSQCREGDTVTILRLRGEGLFKKRLQELGFRKGKELSVVRYAPLRDPMEVEMGGFNISLRVEEAEEIEVEKDTGDEQ